MTVWEYRRVSAEAAAALDPLLAEFGAEGWELVSVTVAPPAIGDAPVFEAWLKRAHPAPGGRSKGAIGSPANW